jgi:hypothetical protein
MDGEGEPANHPASPTGLLLSFASEGTIILAADPRGGHKLTQPPPTYLLLCSPRLARCLVRRRPAIMAAMRTPGAGGDRALFVYLMIKKLN